MQLPDFLSRNHPRDKEAPAWAKVLSEGMGLALEQQDIIMGQLEDVKEASPLACAPKSSTSAAPSRQLQSRPQPVQEPDMSEVLSELNAAMDSDVDSLLASVTGPSEEQPVADEPASAPTNPLPVLHGRHDHQRRRLAWCLINQRAGP
jgi:hypothetical protein